MNLKELLEMSLDSTVKGVPGPMEGRIVLGDVARLGWNLLRGDLPIPVATIDGGALTSNSRWMREFTEANGVGICPHGKTTMAPQLFARQLDDGAWGITVATIQQLQVCRRFGVRRILVANQLVGERDLRAVFRALRDDPDLDVYCLVDSSENVRQLHDAALRFDAGRPLQLLLEGGIVGGRTGCRSMDEAVALAGTIGACGPELALRGIEGFEGIVEGTGGADDEMAVGAYFAFLCEMLKCGIDRRWFSGGKPILTIGGSIYFDLAVTHPDVRALKNRCEVILRSGCYLTHDSRMLARNFDRVRARTPELDTPAPAFRPALTVWGLIQSLPEPGLAILNVGKRDISFDVDLPVAERWFRHGLHAVPVAVPEPTVAKQINDQHLLMRVSPATHYRVGDLVGLGVSHPCTTFDKWKLLYVVDDRFDVIEGILTFF